jgi:hypothetical protein
VSRSRSNIWGGGPISPDRLHHNLGSGNVLCLKALGALCHFKFYSLAFVQRLVAIHLNRGEVHKNIFPGLALDETVALRSIEPLHSSLFLHFHDLEIGIALRLLVRFVEVSKRLTPPSFPSAVTSLSPQKKAAKFVHAAP